MKTVLVINAGSSSIKYQLLAMPSGEPRLQGMLERIHSDDAELHRRLGDKQLPTLQVAAPDHAAGIDVIFDNLEAEGLLERAGELAAIGHRVVHGGNIFTAPVLIDDKVVEQLEDITELAPLHIGPSTACMRAACRRFPGLSQVAVFDTAYHHDLPPHSRHYALPLPMQRLHGIRRYGFHGLSHRYVAGAAAEQLGRPLQELKIVSLHLGNGASACAIQGGRSVDTSMGFTPSEGLIMGSRCGDLDPTLPDFLGNRLGLSRTETERLVNRESGLLGLCGDNDMRRIEARMEAGDTDARLAFDMYCYRIRKYIGAYMAALNGLDALVFTAGIGEHSAAVRAAVCGQMDALGIRLSEERNALRPQPGILDISEPDAPVRILVISTNEELQIARDIQSFLWEDEAVPA